MNQNETISYLFLTHFSSIRQFIVEFTPYFESINQSIKQYKRTKATLKGKTCDTFSQRGNLRGFRELTFKNGLLEDFSQK